MAKRFVSFGEIFVLLSPVLGCIAVRNEMGRVAVPEFRASRIVGRSVLAAKVRSLRSESRAGPHIAIRLKVAARKKLRKGAAKPMKSLVRVNLCARLADGLDIAGPLALSLPF